MHCVDLGESFPTSIYLQNLASIQPRTSLLKFEGGGFSAPVILAVYLAVGGQVGCGVPGVYFSNLHCWESAD